MDISANSETYLQSHLFQRAFMTNQLSRPDAYAISEHAYQEFAEFARYAENLQWNICKHIYAPTEQQFSLKKLCHYQPALLNSLDSNFKLRLNYEWIKDPLFSLLNNQSTSKKIQNDVFRLIKSHQGYVEVLTEDEKYLLASRLLRARVSSDIIGASVAPIREKDEILFVNINYENSVENRKEVDCLSIRKNLQWIKACMRDSNSCIVTADISMQLPVSDYSSHALPFILSDVPVKMRSLLPNNVSFVHKIKEAIMSIFVQRYYDQLNIDRQISAIQTYFEDETLIVQGPSMTQVKKFTRRMHAKLRELGAEVNNVLYLNATDIDQESLTVLGSTMQHQSQTYPSSTTCSILKEFFRQESLPLRSSRKLILHSLLMLEQCRNCDALSFLQRDIRNALRLLTDSHQPDLSIRISDSYLTLQPVFEMFDQLSAAIDPVRINEVRALQTNCHSSSFSRLLHKLQDYVQPDLEICLKTPSEDLLRLFRQGDRDDQTQGELTQLMMRATSLNCLITVVEIPPEEQSSELLEEETDVTQHTYSAERHDGEYSNIAREEDVSRSYEPSLPASYQPIYRSRRERPQRREFFYQRRYSVGHIQILNQLTSDNISVHQNLNSEGLNQSTNSSIVPVYIQSVDSDSSTQGLIRALSSQNEICAAELRLSFSKDSSSLSDDPFAKYSVLNELPILFDNFNMQSKEFFPTPKKKTQSAKKMDFSMSSQSSLSKEEGEISKDWVLDSTEKPGIITGPQTPQAEQSFIITQEPIFKGHTKGEKRHRALIRTSFRGRLIQLAKIKPTLISCESIEGLTSEMIRFFITMINEFYKDNIENYQLWNDFTPFSAKISQWFAQDIDALELGLKSYRGFDENGCDSLYEKRLLDEIYLKNDIHAQFIWLFLYGLKNITQAYQSVSDNIEDMICKCILYALHKLDAEYSISLEKQVILDVIPCINAAKVKYAENTDSSCHEILEVPEEHMESEEEKDQRESNENPDISLSSRNFFTCNPTPILLSAQGSNNNNNLSYDQNSISTYKDNTPSNNESEYLLKTPPSSISSIKSESASSFNGSDFKQWLKSPFRQQRLKEKTIQSFDAEEQSRSNVSLRIEKHATCKSYALADPFMREEGGSMEVAKSNFEETSHEKARDARLSSDGDPEGRKLTDSLLQEGERATDDHKQGMDARFQHTSAEVNHGR